jgi:hypothetical protein
MSRFENVSTGIIVSVADSKVDRFTSGWKTPGAKDAEPKSETPDKTWKVDELKAYAAERDIDLGEATKKDDIIAVLTKPSDD